jgi:wyosine [tRNA(Phe)-imidazoG37] synthetase (radical SAM superfamily)
MAGTQTKAPNTSQTGQQQDPLAVLENILNEAKEQKGSGQAPDLVKTSKNATAKSNKSSPEELAKLEAEKKRKEEEERQRQAQLEANRLRLIEEQKQKLEQELKQTPQYQARLEQEKQKQEEAQKHASAGEGYKIRQLKHTKI